MGNKVRRFGVERRAEGKREGRGRERAGRKTRDQLRKRFTSVDRAKREEERKGGNGKRKNKVSRLRRGEESGGQRQRVGG